MSYDGILLVDKDAGMTSHDVVAKARKILNMKSIGHCGTLDPMATGLMILLLGEGTKLSPYLLEQDKGYVVRAKLGIETDTLDTTGTILKEAAVTSTEKEICDQALVLQGEFELNVPRFSAVKVDGQKMYEKARRQEDFETPIKKMKFYDIQILGSGADWIEASIRCSKGSYIRSWTQLLGQKLGSGAAMSSLRRFVSEPFKLENAQTLQQISEDIQNGLTPKGLIALEDTLPHWKSVRVEGQSLALLRNGQISKDLKSILISSFRPGIDAGVKVLEKNGGLLALVGLEEGRGFVIRRVFRS